MFLNENTAGTFVFHSSFVFRPILVCFCVMIALVADKFCFTVFNEMSSLI